MCPSLFGGKQSTKVAQQQVAEKPVDPTEIGSARKAEDEDLFGGVPDLRSDRQVTGGGVATGTGLQEMQ